MLFPNECVWINVLDDAQKYLFQGGLTDPPCLDPFLKQKI